MPDRKGDTTKGGIEADVALATAGDRVALERVLRSVQRDVHGLAARFLWHPQDAEDAAQEILVRIMTGLSGFRGDASFRTWVYRVACNALISSGRKRMETAGLSFVSFAEDLADGLADAGDDSPDADHALLLEEVKIGCTHAMLLCLDRAHRMAYILGDIIGLDHVEAAAVLEIAPAAYRKRLSRAQADITAFTMKHCGLVEPANACRCRRRLGKALECGRIDPAALKFAPSLAQSQAFVQVLARIRQLEGARRVSALYRSHPEPKPSAAFIVWLRKLADETAAPATP